MTLRYLPLLLACALSSACDAPRSPLGLHAELTRPAPPPEPLRIERLSTDAREGAPLVLAKLGDRKVAFVADEDESAVFTLDLARGVELARTELPGTPTSLLVTADGRLAVALRRAAKVVLLAGPIDGPAGQLSIDRTLSTADEPLALATTPDGASLLVVSGVGRALERFSLHDGTRSLATSLGREPRAVTVLADGARAAVSYAAESAVAFVDLEEPAVRHASLTVRGQPITVTSKKLMTPKKTMSAFDDDFFGTKPKKLFLGIDPDRVARQGYALVRRRDKHGREEILAPHALVTAGEASVPTGGYGGVDVHPPVSFAVAALAGPASPKRSELSDGCRLPRGAALDATTDTLWVACQGEGAVIGYRTSPSLSTRVRLKVPGPSSVAIDPTSGAVVSLAAFDRAVHVFRAPSDPKAAVTTIALSHRPGAGLDPDVAAGRKLFHDAREKAISADGRACASCHPDGRDDGLTWPTPEGPRQTIFLAGRVARSGPFGWSAKHESLPAHVKITMRNLGGTGLDDRRLEQLAAWLRAMPAPPSHEPVLDPEQAQGKAIFESEEAGCASCHGAGAEGSAYEVASATKGDRHDAFLAPSLRSIGATAPYFHDGRYATLSELLRACDGKMGATGHLGSGQLAALEAYLEAL